MPELPAEAVQAAAEALRTKRWGSRGTSAHRAHRFHADCEVCQSNVDAIAEVAVEAAAPFLAGVGSPASCPSAAPESTQSPETTSAAPVYPPGPVGPAETLSALRDRYAAALAATCKLHEIEGACPACERRLTAVLAVRDDELSRALRIADYHATQHRQAEAAVARSRAALAEFDARPWHDVPTPGSVLEAWRTSLAVSEEQTGHACGNCEGIDPASCINAPTPPASTTEETNR